MFPQVEKLTNQLYQLVMPYLGKQEYGGLRLIGGRLPCDETTQGIYWNMLYDMIFGSSAEIPVSFKKKDLLFWYVAPPPPNWREVTTPNVEEVLDHVRSRLENIKPERMEHLTLTAVSMKNDNISLQKAIEEVREFARQHPRFGPTEQELKFYERYCNDIYSQ